MILSDQEVTCCDICRLDDRLHGGNKSFDFEYPDNDGDHFCWRAKTVDLCRNCEERVLRFIRLESGWRF